MSFKSSFGDFEDAGGSWLEFDILILIWIWSVVFDIHMIKILAFYLDLEGARTSMGFKSLFGALEDAGGSWLDLVVPDWGLASWSWFEYGQEPCLGHPWSFDHTQISGSSDADSLESVQLRTWVRSVLNYHFRVGSGSGRVWVGSGSQAKNSDRSAQAELINISILGPGI